MRRRELIMGLTGMTIANLSTPLAMAKPLEAASSLKPTRYLDYDHKDLNLRVGRSNRSGRANLSRKNPIEMSVEGRTVLIRA